MKELKIILLLLLSTLLVSLHLNAQQGNLQQENIYFLTDRHYYISGEKIWFEAFIVQPDQHIGNSTTLYVEIFNEEKHVIHQQKFTITENVATGFIQLSDNLISGNLIIRAYTLYQRNFHPASYCYSMITLINPYKALPASNSHQLGFMVAPLEQQSAKNKNMAYAAFIGEKNLTKKPLNAWISSTRQDSSYKPVKLYPNGLASFMLDAGYSGNAFFNMVTADHDTMVQPFTLQQDEPVSIVVNEKNNTYELHYINKNTTNVPVILQAYNASGNILEEQVTLRYENGYLIDIEKEHLSQGFVAFVIENEEGRKIAQRLIYHFPACYETPINVEIPSNQPDNRLNIHLGGNNEFSNTNMRVAKLSALYDDDETIQAILHHPYLYANVAFDGIVDQNQLNLVLSLVEEKVIGELEKPVPPLNHKDFLIENKGLQLRALVRNKNTLKPVPDVPVYLSVLGKGGYFIPKGSNQHGEIIYTLYNLEGEQSIFLTLPSEYKDSVEVLIQNDFVADGLAFSVPPLHVSPPDKRFIEELLIAAQIEKYAGDQKTRNKKIAPFPKKFYGKPEVHVRLEDYIDLPTLEEVFHEIVINAAVRKRKNKPYFVLFENNNLYSYENPLVLLDNIPVFNYEELLKIPPSKIQYIEVVNNIYVVGNTVFRGIVSLYSYHADFGGYTFPDEVVYVKYLTSTTPTYRTMMNETNPNNRKPDFRNLIFWQHQLKKDSITIDLPEDAKKMKILIRGIGKEGNIIRGDKSITIKKESHQDI